MIFNGCRIAQKIYVMVLRKYNLKVRDRTGGTFAENGHVACGNNADP